MAQSTASTVAAERNVFCCTILHRRRFNQIILSPNSRFSVFDLHSCFFFQRLLTGMISWNWTGKEKGQNEWEKTFES